MTPRAGVATFMGAALLLLAGCASDPATRYYVLAPAAQARTGAIPGKGVSVVVREVRLPQYLDRGQIVTRDSDHQVRLAEYDLWAGDLRGDMTRVLAENLSRALGSDRVVAAPHSLQGAPDARVEVEVQRFEKVAGGRVELAARWWLTRGTDGAPLASASVALAGAPLGSDAGYEAVVASMSAVYAELAREIAQGIPAQGKVVP